MYISLEVFILIHVPLLLDVELHHGDGREDPARHHHPAATADDGQHAALHRGDHRGGSGLCSQVPI